MYDNNIIYISEGNTVLNGNTEIWKDIPSFENRYQASTLGRIRSIQDNHGKYKEQIRSTWISNKGYEYVQLFIKNKSHNVSVHHAVASTFLVNPDNKPTVNHIDGIKKHNHVGNLEWSTYSENLKHAHRLGLSNANHVADRQRGTKIGVTSNYHNVSWDNTRKKWKATLKDKGRMEFQKRFDCEIEAAKYVNTMLDNLGYLDRPRNSIP